MHPFELTITRTRNHRVEAFPLSGISRYATADALQAALQGAIIRWGRFTDEGSQFIACNGGDLTLGDVIGNDLLANSGKTAKASMLAALMEDAGILLNNDTPSITASIDYDARLVRSEDVVIPAWLRNDRTREQTEFDAAPWFAEASTEELQGLVDIQFGGDQPADDVARWVCDADPVLSEALDNCTAGFEVYIDEKAARAWIGAHAPAVTLTGAP